MFFTLAKILCRRSYPRPNVLLPMRSLLLKEVAHVMDAPPDANSEGRSCPRASAQAMGYGVPLPVVLGRWLCQGCSWPRVNQHPCHSSPRGLYWAPMTHLPPTIHPALAKASTNPLLAGTSWHSPPCLTESQNGRGWKGPLWVIQSNPPAEAGSPTAGCTGPCPGGS